MGRIQILLAAIILVGSVSGAWADDTFALALSPHDNLIIFGPQGEQVAELSIPTISRAVKVGSTSFQISYGRDANDYITAILVPSATESQDLHFTVLNKTIHADRAAVVTLTFTDFKHVTVEGARVESASGSSRAKSVKAAPQPHLGTLMTPAPPPALAAPEPPGVVIPAGTKLFWAEPITPPSGVAPSVEIDQMKLTAVHGTVTVKTPDGQTQAGADDLVVPSGSSITTADQGSAAVFIGGVDSVRFLPNSDAIVTQKLEGSTRHTTVNLHLGAVFARVGHRPGEKQRFEVKTHEGIAAAHGTSFSVTVTTFSGHEVTVCASQHGSVTLTNTRNDHEITIEPRATGQISIGSVPSVPSAGLAQIFITVMTQLQQFNTNLQAIAAETNPSTADSTYLQANQIFVQSTSNLYDANSSSVFSLTTDGQSR